MIMCVLLCYPVSIRIYYQQGVLFLVFTLDVILIFAVMKQYKPTDATTNPSLILQASQKPEYAKLIDDAIDYAKSKSG